MLPVLEAVPNFSEGRDLGLVRALVDVIAHEGAEVVDWSADPDHHRSVVTFLGDPATVEAAAIASARFAMEHIDLRRHAGVHPRIGAIDVLPFVPLTGLSIDDAAQSAHRVGAALADMGLPVFWYGAAAASPRSLSMLRRGGFEAIQDGFPPDRQPDLQAGSAGGPHPSAGAVCVGARDVLLAWNVIVAGLELSALRDVAAALREKEGGFRSLRTLALSLPSRPELQLSMNLEDPASVSPLDVFEAIESRVRAAGGRVVETEVIGMIPDALVLPGAADRLRLQDSRPSRLLSARLVDHLSRRAGAAIEELLSAIDAAEETVPAGVIEAARRVATTTGHVPNSGY